MEVCQTSTISAFQNLKLTDEVTTKSKKTGGGSGKAQNSLKDLIEELHEVFSADHVNIDYVKTLMSQFKSVRKEWKKFAKFDPHRYTRNLVDSGNGKFNLMILCWNESQGSSIHSHADSHCFLKVMEGQVKEELYDWPSDSERVAEIEPEVGLHMAPRQELTHGKDAVTYINDDIGLHRVENPSHTERAVTLHLYSPPFDSCHTFDQRTGKRRTSIVTFFSEKGKRTPFMPESLVQLQERAEDN